jgi:hypothetical protein
MKQAINNFGLEIFAFLAIFFAELEPTLWAIGFLIMTDTGLAIWATWKHNGIDSIKSRKLGRIITKVILYPLAIIVAKVAEQYLAPSIPWTDVTAGIIATVEIKSIFEKMGLILGFNLWSRIKKAIWKDKLEDELDNDKK